MARAGGITRRDRLGRRSPRARSRPRRADDDRRLRGDLTPDQCTCTFPDDRGTSLTEVRARLARVVCADPEQLADGDLEAIALAVEEAQVASISDALERVAARVPAGTGAIA